MIGTNVELQHNDKIYNIFIFILQIVERNRSKTVKNTKLQVH